MILNTDVPPRSNIEMLDIAQRLLLVCGIEGDQNGFLIEAELSTEDPFHPDDVARLVLALLNLGKGLAINVALLETRLPPDEDTYDKARDAIARTGEMTRSFYEKWEATHPSANPPAS